MLLITYSLVYGLIIGLTLNLAADQRIVGKFWDVCFDILFCKDLVQLSRSINKCTFLCAEANVLKDSVEPRITTFIISSKNESDEFCCRMGHIMSNALDFSFTILNEAHCSIFIITVGVVNVCPYTFNIFREIYVLNVVGVSIDRIAGSEMIVSLTLPKSESSVTHSDVVVLFVLGQPSHKVPWLVLS